MASVPSVLGAVEHDLRLTGFAAGALTGLPVLCMGVFAPLAHRAAHRLGREATVAAALAVLASGLLLRPAGGAAPALYAGTLLAGTGLALVGTILPGIVKEHFRGRPGLGTSAYSGAMALGAALAAGLAVPLADALGSWRRSLAAWAVPAVVALVVWAAVALRGNEYEPEEESAEGRPGGLPWRSRLAWLVSGYLAVQSVAFYGALAWLAPSYVARGWAAADAGALLATFGAAQIVSTLVAPAVTDRFPDRRPLLAVAAACASAAWPRWSSRPGWRRTRPSLCWVSVRARRLRSG